MDWKKYLKVLSDNFTAGLVDKITYYIGLVLSFPFIVTHAVIGYPPAIRERDFNKWTYGHILITYFLTHVAYSILEFSPWGAFAFGFGIMYLWELIIDSNRLSDYAFSTQDIGADFIGAIVPTIIFLIGGRG